MLCSISSTECVVSGTACSGINIESEGLLLQWEALFAKMPQIHVKLLAGREPSLQGMYMHIFVF